MIDFTNEVEFDSINTKFTVEKNGIPAVLDFDYSSNNGKFTFHNEGIFSLIMSNEAIVSHPSYPSIVIATINVGQVGLNNISTSNIKIYPNPTKEILNIEYENNFEMQLFNIQGKEILEKKAIENTARINIGHLPKGIYTIRISSQGKTIDNCKIIKQ